MSLHDESLRKAIRQLTRLDDQAVLATVTAVDLNKQTVDVAPLAEPEVLIYSVRLTADVATTGVIAVPVVGSTVVVATVGNNWQAAYVAMVSDVATVLLRGDALGGLVKVQPLVTRLNALENAVNALNVAMAAHVHPVLTPAGAPFPAAPLTGPFPIVLAPLTPTLLVQIENPNVLQG